MEVESRPPCVPLEAAMRSVEVAMDSVEGVDGVSRKAEHSTAFEFIDPALC